MAAAALMPIGILADLQWRLYEFGHALNPTAPIRLKPFTPLVIGPTQMGNFVSTAMISWGVVCLVGAALLLWAGGRMSGARRRGPAPAGCAARGSARRHARPGHRAGHLAGAQASAPPGLLQGRIDATARGGTLVVPPGIYAGPILIRGPLSVIAEPGAVIDGGGTGSVVTIAGDDVVFRGFTVRNSGREVTQEAAGITVTGNRHRIEANHVHDVYFGVHIGAGRARRRPGQHDRARG